jgi:hypothetical protein
MPELKRAELPPIETLHATANGRIWMGDYVYVSDGVALNVPRGDANGTALCAAKDGEPLVWTPVFP